MAQPDIDERFSEIIRDNGEAPHKGLHKPDGSYVEDSRGFAIDPDRPGRNPWPDGAAVIAKLPTTKLLRKAKKLRRALLDEAKAEGEYVEGQDDDVASFAEAQANCALCIVRWKGKNFPPGADVAGWADLTIEQRAERLSDLPFGLLSWIYGELMTRSGNFYGSIPVDSTERSTPPPSPADESSSSTASTSS